MKNINNYTKIYMSSKGVILFLGEPLLKKGEKKFKVFPVNSKHDNTILVFMKIINNKVIKNDINN